MGTTTSRKILTAIAIAVAALVVSACSDGDAASSDDEKVTLQYWAWAPGSADEVAEFNRTHPNIEVVHTDAAAGISPPRSCWPRSARATPPTLRCPDSRLPFRQLRFGAW